MPENNLSAKAYKLLEEAIVLLKLKPSKIYSEKELMELFKISRTPLREALLKLSAQSLINIIPRRGIEISDINMYNQLAILDTRRVLDHLLISRATKYSTPQEKQSIHAFKEPMYNAVANQDIKEYLRVDKVMDQKIFDIARNPYATKATLPLHTRSRRFWYYFKGVEHLEESAKTHTGLIDAIVNGDEKQAIIHSNEIIDTLVNVAKSYM